MTRKLLYNFFAFGVFFWASTSYASTTSQVEIELYSSTTGTLEFLQFAADTGEFLGQGVLTCDGESNSKTTVLYDESAVLPSVDLGDYEFTGLKECHDWIAAQSKILRLHRALLSFDPRTAKISYTPTPKLVSSDSVSILDRSTHINNIYKFTGGHSTTKYFYHGKRTEKVHIYLHGLFMGAQQFTPEAIAKFNEGENVIVAVLPGHEIHSSKIMWEYTEDDWLRYSSELADLAHLMGEQVIVEGQSLGGLLGFILAVQNKVDQAVLFQPSLRLSKWTELEISPFGFLAQTVTGFYKDFSPHGGQLVARLIHKFIDCHDKNFCAALQEYKVPTIITLARNDDVVDTKAIKSFFQSIHSPFIQIEEHNYGHMYTTSEALQMLP